MKYKIALLKTEEGYSVSVPGLPGCWSQGATEAEALENARDSETFNKLRSEIRTLSEAERAELAHELIKSLDAPVDSDVMEARDREILRRLSEIETGTANLIDRTEFQRRLQGQRVR